MAKKWHPKIYFDKSLIDLEDIPYRGFETFQPIKKKEKLTAIIVKKNDRKKGSRDPSNNKLF
jgi:hypothetical protein